MSFEATSMPFSGFRVAFYVFAALPIILGVALIILGIVVIVKFKRK